MSKLISNTVVSKDLINMVVEIENNEGNVTGGKVDGGKKLKSKKNHKHYSF